MARKKKRTPSAEDLLGQARKDSKKRDRFQNKGEGDRYSVRKILERGSAAGPFLNDIADVPVPKKKRKRKR